jgi:GAF domain-containing protein
MDPGKTPSKVFDGIAKVCLEIFEGEKASLMLVVPKTGQLEVQSAVGYGKKNIIGERKKIGEGVAGWVAQNREPVMLVNPSDKSKYPGLKFEPRTISAAMVVPIMLNDKLIGVLNLSSRSPRAFFEEQDLRVFQTFAENVATWIHHTLQTRKMVERINELERSQGAGSRPERPSEEKPKPRPVVHLPHED